SDQLPSFDPPTHTAQRGLLMRLITPKRLKENAAFMWRLADRQIDEFLARAACALVPQHASPLPSLAGRDPPRGPRRDPDPCRGGDGGPSARHGVAADW